MFLKIPTLHHNACASLRITGLQVPCLLVVLSLFTCKIGQRALAIANAYGFTEAAFHATLLVGRSYFQLGDFNSAIDWEHKALDLAKQLGAVRSQARTLNSLGSAFFNLGKLNEATKAAAADAALAVPNIEAINNELTLPAIVESLNLLNALEPVEFATGSSVITEGSAATLDAAAEILLANEGGAVVVEGYTDITGNADANQVLSEERAAAVEFALVLRGVDPEMISSIGFGGTTQFAEGDSPEALAANRLVRFVAAE